MGFAHSRYCAGTGEHDAWNTLFSCVCGGSCSVCGQLGLLHGLRQSAGVAAELGYFDQAHLANEVALFAGTSPGRIAPHRVADFSKTRCE
jgi:hypothetical protein